MSKAPNLKRQAIEQRSRARRQLLQILYQWQISGDEPRQAYLNRLTDPNTGDVDQHYFDDAYGYICEHNDDLEALYSDYMSRQPKFLDPIERAILWIGAYEIRQRFDIHHSVSINEAVELAKQFGGEDSYKFINATLDKLAKNSKTAAPPSETTETVQDDTIPEHNDDNGLS